MVVAGISNRNIGLVIKLIMRNPDPNPIELNRGTICCDPTVRIVNEVVDNHVITTCECVPITALNINSPFSDLINSTRGNNCVRYAIQIKCAVAAIDKYRIRKFKV